MESALNPKTPRPPRWFRYTWINRIMFTLFVGFVGGITLLFTFEPLTGNPAFPIWLLLAGLVLTICVRSMRIGIVMRTDTLLVRNVFRSLNTEYDSIKDVRWKPEMNPWAIVIELKDGRRIRPIATGLNGIPNGGLDAAYFLKLKLANLRGQPMPPSPEEMMRQGLRTGHLGNRPPPPQAPAGGPSQKPPPPPSPLPDRAGGDS